MISEDDQRRRSGMIILGEGKHVPGPHRLPRPDLVEGKIEMLWRQVLDIDSADLDDDFFDLGGTSLRVVQLLNRIQVEFDLDLSPVDVYEHPTLGAMAGFVRGQAGAAEHRDGCVLHIAERDTGAPSLFVIHPGGGDVLDLRELSGAGLAGSVFGLAPIGLADHVETPHDARAMARHYADHVQDKAGEAPFVVGGFCVGGVVAFELAQELLSRGADVRGLILFDSVSFQREPVEVSAEDILLMNDVLDDMGEDLEAVRRLPAELRRLSASSGTWVEVQAIVNALEPFLRAAILEMHAIGRAVTDVDVRSFLRFYEVWARYLFAARSAVHAPLDLPIYALTSRELAGQDPTDTWRALAQRGLVGQHFSEVLHGSMFESPDVAAFLRSVPELAASRGTS